MKAQPTTVRGLQGPFVVPLSSLLAVGFATMVVRDVARKEFYEASGLDARSYEQDGDRVKPTKPPQGVSRGAQCRPPQVLRAA